MKSGPGMRYLLNMVLLVQYFASEYLKRTFEKQLDEIGSIKYVVSLKYSLYTVH